MSESEDEDTIKAREILSWRPGLRASTLPSKGGPKFFGQNDQVLEEHKVDTQLKKYESSLRSQKVRKLCNLGRAEWMPEAGAAKITKQGKFIQSMGHHNGEFFALNAEEALFLLDIGDIELCMNDVPMALQEAFSLVFNNSKSCCVFDDYITYANLVKRGFIVQRFGTENSRKRKPTKRKPPDAINPPSKRAENDTNQPSTSRDSEAEKTFMPVTTDLVSQDVCGELQSRLSGKELRYRDWFIGKNQFEGSQKEKDESVIESITFPNLADSSCTHLPAPNQNLVPLGIPARDFQIEETWFQRLKKHSGKAKNHTFHQRSHVSGIAKLSKNWSEYKVMVKTALDDRKKRVDEMDRMMQSGKIKPLLKRNDSLSRVDILNKIQIFNEMKPKDFAGLEQSDKFAIKYNVYQCGLTAFKKTAPGKPFCRIVVTNVKDNPPEFNEILSLIHTSNGVPLKFAAVDCGQVSYYALENVEVQNVL